jgi:hypothetical protein
MQFSSAEAENFIVRPGPVAAEIAAQIAGADSRAMAFYGEFTKFLQLFQTLPAQFTGWQNARVVLAGLGWVCLYLLGR